MGTSVLITRFISVFCNWGKPKSNQSEFSLPSSGLIRVGKCGYRFFPFLFELLLRTIWPHVDCVEHCKRRFVLSSLEFLFFWGVYGNDIGIEKFSFFLSPFSLQSLFLTFFHFSNHIFSFSFFKIAFYLVQFLWRYLLILWF